MTALNASALATLRDAEISVSEWARHNYMSNGEWCGDACGCPDSRCIGFHHDAGDECGCLPTLLADHAGGGR
ncbi:hypothetical protein [Nocardia salmonicida]|uniref:hypothetical protein n=1 Tax=Nocardia salmonicida TaxID=53431 RepID=UPI0033CB8CB5